MGNKLTGIVLRQGAWYAVEQGGRLLQSSGLLLKAGDFCTAVGLAMFAGEELGRSTILRKLAARADSGESISPQAVLNACEDHVEKQRLGNFGIEFNTNRETGLGKLLVKSFDAPVGSKEHQDAEAQIKEAMQAKEKRLPSERHDLRMSAFYVDLTGSGQWRRPSSIDQETAQRAVQEVLNNYLPERDRLLTGLSAAADVSEMAEALEKMNPQPNLPVVTL